MPEQRAHRAFVGLGSNLDDPSRQVRCALEALRALPCTRLVRRSRLYRSDPVGYREQPDFVNAVAELETGLAARPLLQALQSIEQAQRRVRAVPNGPRTLDLDLLLFDACRIDQPNLTVPHPRMQEREFVLRPLAEIAPDLNIPGHGSVAALLAQVASNGTAALPDEDGGMA